MQTSRLIFPREISAFGTGFSYAIKAETNPYSLYEWGLLLGINLTNQSLLCRIHEIYQGHNLGIPSTGAYYFRYPLQFPNHIHILDT